MKNLLYDINRQILIDIFHFFLPYLRATHLFEVWQEDLSWCGRSQILSLSLSLWIPILSQRRTFLHVLSNPPPLSFPSPSTSISQFFRKVAGEWLFPSVPRDGAGKLVPAAVSAPTPQ